MTIRSGEHDNATPVEGVVFSTLVTMPTGTPWLRLFFAKAHLDGGSYLRIVSLRDGGLQTLHARHLVQWRDSSAFFNGATVLLELVAGPNTRGNVVEIDKVMAADLAPASPPPETICGSTDDRVPSSHAAVGRIDPIGCTGWIVDAPATGDDKVHLSAGHCFAPYQVLEFQVPGSNADCSLVHPPPARQFAIDPDSLSSNAGPGNDYWVFKCFPNSTTNLTTYQTQGAALSLAPALPAVNATLRTYGFGNDGTNANNALGDSCSCTGATGQRNQTQQTHSGALVSVLGAQVLYGIDTCGGDSGSVVIDEGSGLAVAIHTNAGCASAGGSNSGTAVASVDVQQAINSLANGQALSPVSWVHTSDRFDQATVFHPVLQKVLAFGGSGDESAVLSDTRVYDDSVGWTSLSVGGSPGALTGSAMAPTVSGSVLFGGRNAAGSIPPRTWQFTGNVWTEWQQVGAVPPPRTGHAMAFDSFRSRVVLFGGDAGTQLLNDTWEWSLPNGWVPVTTSFSPPTLRRHAMSYDVQHRRVVMQGGQTTYSGSIGNTYLFDGSNWLNIGFGGGPGSRIDHAMASDDQGRTILYGGLGGLSPAGNGDAMADTWLFDGSTWVQVGKGFGAGGPGQLPYSPDTYGRFGHRMSWDSVRRVFVVTGGRNGGLRPSSTYRLSLGAVLTDTVEWDVANVNTPTWSSPSVGDGPVARLDSAITANPISGDILLFGGSRVAPAFTGGAQADVAGDFWYRRNGDWIPLTNGVVPARARHVMSWDTAHSEYLIFGGVDGSLNPLSDTWTGSPASGWQLRAGGPNGPAAALWCAMASTASGVLLHGGFASSHNGGSQPGNGCYRWNGSTWIQLAGVGPGARGGHAMAYDEGRNVVVLFGGSSRDLDVRRPQGDLDDTWEWDGQSWSQRVTAHKPPKLVFHTMAYDKLRERTVVFGGVDDNWDARADVWEWDGVDWALRVPAVPAPARFGHSMTYDHDSKKVVTLFGEVGGLLVVGPWEYGPTQPARVTSYGTGCPGALGPLSIRTVDSRLPWTGSTLPVEIGNLPAASVPFVLIGFARAQIDLSPLGLPGCTQFVSINSSPYRGPPVGNVVTYNMNIPADSSFAGLPICFQGAAINAGGANSVGAAVSSAIEAVVGVR